MIARLAAFVLLVANPWALAQTGARYIDSGTEIPLVIDPSALCVTFEEGLPESVLSDVLRASAVIDPGALPSTRIAAGVPILVKTIPGLTDAEILGAAAEIEAFPFVRAAAPLYMTGGGALHLMTDELIVRWKPEVTREEQVSLESAFGLQARGEVPYASNPGVIYRAPGPAQDVLDIALELNATGLVSWAMPDFWTSLDAYGGTNDPKYTSGNTWHLNTASYSGEDPDIDAPEAWDFTVGTGVRVAVIDTGFDLDQEDLVNQWTSGYDFLNNDTDPSCFVAGPIVTDPHGTAVAGLVGARGNNGLGTTGVCQNCVLVPIQVCTEQGGTGGFCQVSFSKMASGIGFAWNQGAAAVITSSVGNTQLTSVPIAVQNAINDAVTFGRNGLGCVVFIAGGDSPLAHNIYSHAVGVLAITSSDQNAKAVGNAAGPEMDLCAPGLQITTTDATDTGAYACGGFSSTAYTSNFGNASAATPIAAGVGALVVSVRPDLTWTQIQDILLTTADWIDQAGGAYDGNCHSNLYGYGKVNADAAVIKALHTPPWPVLYGCQTPPDCHGFPAPPSGCFGVAGTKGVPLIGGNGVPHIGNSGFKVLVDRAKPSAAAYVIVSLAPASLSYAGGLLLVDPAQKIVEAFPTTNAAGHAEVSLPIPNDVALIGLNVYAQWIIADSAGPLNKAFSAGLKVSIIQ